jgi:hypothetical protein
MYMSILPQTLKVSPRIAKTLTSYAGPFEVVQRSDFLITVYASCTFFYHIHQHKFLE